MEHAPLRGDWVRWLAQEFGEGEYQIRDAGRGDPSYFSVLPQHLDRLLVGYTPPGAAPNPPPFIGPLAAPTAPAEPFGVLMSQVEAYRALQGLFGPPAAPPPPPPVKAAAPAIDPNLVMRALQALFQTPAAAPVAAVPAPAAPAPANRWGAVSALCERMGWSPEAFCDAVQAGYVPSAEQVAAHLSGQGQAPEGDDGDGDGDPFGDEDPELELADDEQGSLGL